MKDPIMLTIKYAEEEQFLICISDIAYCEPYRGGSKVHLKMISTMREFDFKESPQRIYEMIADRALEKEILT